MEELAAFSVRRKDVISKGTAVILVQVDKHEGECEQPVITVCITVSLLCSFLNP